MNYLPDENFEYPEEDSFSYNNQHLFDLFLDSGTTNIDDYIQNQKDIQTFNHLYFKSIEAQSSLIDKNGNKPNDDFEKLKIEADEKKICKTQEATFKQKNDGKKSKEKIIFKIDKKIPTKNKREKVNEKSENKNKITVHDKYAYDNIIRKCKFILISHIMDFINEKIKEKFKFIGHGTKIKQLMKLNKKQISNAKADFNIEFMNKQLKEIFSDDITKRYTKYPLKKNEILIKELINEKDDEKRTYFNNLFSLTFLDCLNHFINKKFIPILHDLELFKEIINDSNKSKKKNLDTNDKEYLNELESYFENYENILRRKRPRQKSKKNSSL